MLPENTLGWGQSRSCIRELFEYGLMRKAQIGDDLVYDFSLGNPNIPPPACVSQAIRELLDTDPVALHGYTSAAGRPSLRKAIAAWMKKEYGIEYQPSQICVTSGAKHNVFVALQAICNPGDEVIIPAPFWVSYPEMVALADGIPVIVESK